MKTAYSSKAFTGDGQPLPMYVYTAPGAVLGMESVLSLPQASLIKFYLVLISSVYILKVAVP